MGEVGREVDPFLKRSGSQEAVGEVLAENVTLREPSTPFHLVVQILSGPLCE